MLTLEETTPWPPPPTIREAALENMRERVKEVLNGDGSPNEKLEMIDNLTDLGLDAILKPRRGRVGIVDVPAAELEKSRSDLVEVYDYLLEAKKTTQDMGQLEVYRNARILLIQVLGRIIRRLEKGTDDVFDCVLNVEVREALG